MPDVLFELGAPERYEIVRLLASGEKRPSEIASKLRLTRSDTSRHLSRLSKGGLAEKSVNGYALTILGHVVIRYANSIEFFLKNQDYFRAHMWEILPESLLSRIYALNEAKLHDGVTQTLKMVDDAIKSSREYLLVVLSEVPFYLVPSVLGRLTENVPVKLALTKEAIDHVTQFFKENPQYNPELLKRATIRVIDSCFACTAINEKVAGTNLINREKPHDHFSSHFIGESPGFREWCKDVYELHEEKSKPV